MRAFVQSLLTALGVAAASVAAAPPAHAQKACVPVGEWMVPGAARIEANEVLSRSARGSVVLIGEQHENADHHRWQLQTVAALAGLRPRIVLGFEMFPRRVQGALDRWVAGELSEEEFLRASEWNKSWGMETEHYLPLFHFARINRIPMVALNVERELVRAARAGGFDSVPAEKREGVSPAAPASEQYLNWLFTVYAQHAKKGSVTGRDDPEFRRFVEAELVWDSAMAQAIASAAARDPKALVIGIMGSGHIQNGYGVAHQLRSLGVTQIASLLPWSAGSDCGDLTAGLATAVYGLPAPSPARQRQLLGVTVETVPNGVRLLTVSSGSVAESTGLRVGDVVTEAAGKILKELTDLRSIVQTVAPGTWLPLKVRRQEEILDFVAKFPPAK